MSEFKFADNVWHRVVQIVQEAMLSGVDCADLLRQVRVTESEEDASVLVLSSEYQAQVKAMHEKMLKQARELQAQKVQDMFIIPDSGNSN